MNLNCKLLKKSFTNSEKETLNYYVLQFDLGSDEKLEIPIKGDKARLLILSFKLNDKLPDAPFFNQDDINSLKN